ncbi:uncharacterized protein LOC106718111 [Papilio machaon]|uniref:uncharacterized protein LOC106718111 n=1 Tax=Papilio machaon TaxID=76193 RepID=UPI001E66465B|nr:uncharacterized protein LOC106718111 [Papilio machaon]
MSRFNYGNNPQYPPPQNPIYPQIYNPTNAPAPVPGHPGNPHYGYPAPGQPYPNERGFAYPYQPVPIQPTSVPAAMSYPNVMPTAPQYPGQPIVTPTQSYVGGGSPVEWIPTTPRDAASLSNKAIIGGYEGYDGSPLWVIRARYEGDLIPGKLAVKHHAAYVPWGGNENAVQNIEVCCAPPERVRWVECRDGVIPPNAVVGGNTSSGEPLYVGRAKEQGSLTPGKVHPSHKGMYISFAGKEIAHKMYEILCHA